MSRKGITLSAVLFALTVLMVGAISISHAQSANPAQSGDWQGYSNQPGYVYTMTNAKANAILVFYRSPYGKLLLAARVPTGGVGGAGQLSLGSVNSVVLSKDGRWLFALNEGDNSISLFKQSYTGLKLVDKVSSGGVFPVSLALSGGLVYVLNDGVHGSPANVSGFAFDDDRGALYPIANSSRSLSARSPAAPGLGPLAPQIGFDNSGSFFYVTELGTSLIDKYYVREDGTPDGPDVGSSHGQSPFAFEFDRQNHLLVTEVFEVPSPVGKGAISSYQLDDDGILSTIDGSVPDYQSAPCWLVITRNGRFAYTTNTASGNISGYRVRYDGDISLLDSNGITASTSGPLDLALTRDSRFLYTVTASGTLIGWRVGEDGKLISLRQVTNIPAGSAGAAAR